MINSLRPKLTDRDRQPRRLLQLVALHLLLRDCQLLLHSRARFQPQVLLCLKPIPTRQLLQRMQRRAQTLRNVLQLQQHLIRMSWVSVTCIKLVPANWFLH